MMLNVPVIAVLYSLSWVVGMVIFTNYANCDPWSLNLISKFDEIVPFYVEDKFNYLPGLLGIVMATLFNSALTLAVSNLNSLSTVTFEDFLCQLPSIKKLTEVQQLKLIKLIAVIYGVFIIGASYLVSLLSGVIESSMLMTSATSGPLLGVFVLAMLVPCANWKGAASGMVFSHITTLWLTFGRISLNLEKEVLPLSTADCRNDTFAAHYRTPAFINATNFLSSTIVPDLSSLSTEQPILEVDNNPLYEIYAITYMYYAFIGSMSTIIVGTVISLLTADEKEDAYEEYLLHPLAVKVSRWLPGRPRLYLGSTRLENNMIDGSIATITANNGKLTPSCNGADGKNKLDTSYVEKLDVLKKASLEVTSEVTKGTRL